VVPLVPSVGPMPPPDEGGDAVAEAVVCLLRRHEMHVSVDTCGSQDKMLARDGVGRGTGAECRGHTFHDIGVTGLADTCDLAVLDTDIGLDDTEQRVEDGDVGDDEVERPGIRRDCVGRAHAVADGLAASVDDLVAVDAEVLLYFDIEVCIAQADLVACGRAEQIVIFLSGYFSP